MYNAERYKRIFFVMRNKNVRVSPYTISIPPPHYIHTAHL
jgi:hypothetical protein